MKRLGAVLLILLLASPLVLALNENYRVTIDPVKNSIFPNEPAEFKLRISNFDRSDLRFQVYTLDPKWVVRVDPYLQPIPAESMKEFTLYVRPKSTVGYGTEGLTVSVKNLNSNIIQQQRLIINVKDPNSPGGVYQPSISFDALYPEEIDPRKPLSLLLSFRNRNALNVTALTVSIESPLFQRSYVTTLDPLGERREEQRFTLNPYQAAGDYPLTLKLIYKNKTINEVSKTLHINRIEDIEKSVTKESSLFRSVTRVVVTNKGNAEAEPKVTLPTGWFRRLFSSTRPEAEVERTPAGRFFVWRPKLAPQESVTLERIENYRLLVIILLLAIIGVITYYVTRSPVIAVKEILMRHEEGEEGSNDLKVRLFIKNRSGATLTGVTIIDRIPSIATYEPETKLGTISPTKVIKQKKGAVLKWELDILEPYEERILSYNLSSTLKIVGRFKLPNAKVHFTKNNKERVTYTRNVHYEE